VEPKLPADLRNRKVSDVVIVRILVSQSGHPARVNVLRRSKLGPSLDDAVVAAVSQWTFSPARKRGEAVSSWYNVGIPVNGGT
jgi:TonB family protein